MDRLIRALLCGLAVPVFIAGTALADPRGMWMTEGGKSRIEILDCDGKLCGRIVWIAEPNNEDGSPKRDIENDDPALRDRPILGLELLTGFSDDGDGEWTGGRIYNPEDGETYRSKLELRGPNALKVSGCVLFFCQGQIWTRFE